MAKGYHSGQLQSVTHVMLTVHASLSGTKAVAILVFCPRGRTAAITLLEAVPLYHEEAWEAQIVALGGLPQVLPQPATQYH